MGVVQSPLAHYSLSPGFAGEPTGTKNWVGVCKGQFEKTGICQRQGCARANLRSLLAVGWEGQVLGLMQELKLPEMPAFSFISDA
jgi:hypothetical protein